MDPERERALRNIASYHDDRWYRGYLRDLFEEIDRLRDVQKTGREAMQRLGDKNIELTAEVNRLRTVSECWERLIEDKRSEVSESVGLGTSAPWDEIVNYAKTLNGTVDGYVEFNAKLFKDNNELRDKVRALESVRENAQGSYKDAVTFLNQLGTWFSDEPIEEQREIHECVGLKKPYYDCRTPQVHSGYGDATTHRKQADRLPQWLHDRYAMGERPWGELTDAHRQYWSQEAATVREAISRMAN